MPLLFANLKERFSRVEAKMYFRRNQMSSQDLTKIHGNVFELLFFLVNCNTLSFNAMFCQYFMRA